MDTRIATRASYPYISICSLDRKTTVEHKLPRNTARTHLDMIAAAGHWGSRAEPIFESAETVVRFLRDLRAIHPTFADSWKTYTVAQQSSALAGESYNSTDVTESVDGVVVLLEDGRSDRDSPAWQSPPERGYKIRLFGRVNTYPAVWIHCGANNVDDTQVKNTVEVKFPRPGMLAWLDEQPHETANVLHEVMQLIVTRWSVDIARINDTVLAARQDLTAGDLVKRMALQREEVRGVRTGLYDTVMWEQYDVTGFPTLDRALLPRQARLIPSERGAILRVGENPLDVPTDVLDQTRHALGYRAIPR